MKRIIIIAAAFAALTACSKTETETVNVTEPVGGTSFEKGQTVTLTVSTSGQTKVTSAADLSSGVVSFKWELKDSIKVTVNKSSSIFKVSELIEGGTSAKFTGEMPASGATFDVQYPVNPPVLSEQTYSSTEAIPHDKMLFSAKNCSIADGSFTLTALNAALRLNLYGSKPIGKIVVSDGRESPTTYTLTCGEPGTGITPGTTAEDATPFFIVVPEGAMKFTAEVFDNGATPAEDKPSGALDGLFTVADNHIFTPSQTQTFEAGGILNMSSKEVIFPTKVRFSQGNLRAKKESDTWTWGFYDDQYDVNSIATDESGSRVVDEDETEIDLFTWGYGNWSTTPVTESYQEGEFTDWGTKVGDGNTWRTLTKDEWSYLINNRSNTLYRCGVSVCGKSNCLVIAPDNWDTTAHPLQSEYNADTWPSAESAGLVCLPAAGCRDYFFVSDVGVNCNYWSSTAYYGSDAYRLNFNSSNVIPDSIELCTYGCSVRLVSAAQ